MANPMMKCGHAANATTVVDGKRVPVCAICALIDPGARVVDEAAPSLEGRTAVCTYSLGGRDHVRHGYGEEPTTEPVPSNTGLAFFESKPNEPHDRYYCGCWGWD